MNTLTRAIAKSIICAEPPSISLRDKTRGVVAHAVAGFVDVVLQRWALSQADYFTDADWEEVRIKKLRSLFVYAQQRVPFWKNSFEATSFDPAKMQNVQELRKLPMTSRQMVRAQKEGMIAAALALERSVEASTSGSTGEPLAFFQDVRDIFRRKINTYEEIRYGVGRSWHHMPILVLALQRHFDLSDFQPRFDFAALDTKQVRYGQIYPYIEKKHPVLIAGTGALRRLETVMRHDGKQLKLKAIFYRGEQLHDTVRERMSRFFGCDLFTTYGTRECSLLGIECQYHTVHTAPWMNYVEILREDGTLAPEGETGDIVVTLFENFVMPFIRYRIGDRGNITKMPCACGRSAPRLTFIGKAQLDIRLPNYFSVPLTNLTIHIDQHFSEHILQFQFEQVRTHLIFRYVFSGKGNREGIEKQLRDYFDKQLRGQVTLEFVVVDEIPTASNEKTPLLISRDIPK